MEGGKGRNFHGAESLVIPETGILGDYKNEINIFIFKILGKDYLELYELMKKTAAKKGKLILRYEERNQSPDAINDVNYKRVEAINLIVDQINNTYANGTLSIGSFIRALKALYIIIEGNDKSSRILPSYDEVTNDILIPTIN